MKLSYDLTPSLLNSLKELEISFAQTAQSLENTSQSQQDALHRYALVSMVGSSTRIENALLTDPEINWLDTILTQNGKITAFEEHRALIEHKLSKDRERSIEEVAGCRSMLMLIYNQATTMSPLRESDLRGLHYELMSPYKKAITYAGVYKTQPNSVVEENHVTKERRVVFQTADAGPITQSAMTDLIIWYNDAIKDHAWPLAVVCEFVFRFLAIHPFQDGNGRLGRGLFLLGLFQSPSPYIQKIAPFLAIDRFVEKHKTEYYAVLNRCSQGQFRSNPQEYAIDHFLRFMIKVLNESLDNISVLKNRLTEEMRLSDTAIHVLHCFREFPEIRLTTSQVMAHTHLPRRTIIYSLNQLMDKGFIQRLGEGAGTRYQITF